MSPSRSSVHGFLGLTSTKQWVNVTCSRPQQTVPRPGLEPGTPACFSVVEYSILKAACVELERSWIPAVSQLYSHVIDIFGNVEFNVN